MLVARRRASASRRDPGRTWAATSAMWMKRRMSSPSTSAETASSKSRAVAGSTVKVGSAVRSRLAAPTSTAREALLAASSVTTRRKPRSDPPSQSRAATTSRGTSARPSERRARAPPGPKSTSARSPSPTSADPRASGAPGARSKSGSASRKRPRPEIAATRRPRPLPLPLTGRPGSRGRGSREPCAGPRRDASCSGCRRRGHRA